MLGEHAFGFVGGAGSCSGCGEGTVVRMVMAATLQVYGPESMGIVAETGCNSVFASTYPFNPFTVPWTNSLFENGPADALGIRLRWDQAGHADRRLWVFGGDGAMYDIGFQSLSRLVASGHGHQGPGPGHRRLLEHRRPDLDRFVHRARSPSSPPTARPSTASRRSARSWAGS